MSTISTRRGAALADLAEDIGRDTAALHADAVDRDARFPVEAMADLGAAGALGAAVPEAYGGRGDDLGELAQACLTLGRHCASTAMVFAMHQIQVLSLVRHTDGSPWLADYLRSVATEGRLIASATSEVGIGGDLSRSTAALRRGPGGLRFQKQAPTVSYGAHADDVLVTLRRTPESDKGDQVAVLARRGDYEMEPTGSWDPLGMRGTCSPGFVITGRIEPGQVVATPFATIAQESMTPIAHVLWSHVWLGIACDAFERARAFVRAGARKNPEAAQPTMAALRLSQLSSELSPLRAEVAGGLADFMAVPDGDREALHTLSVALRFNNLKIVTSVLAPQICRGAMEVCGIAGYRNDTPFSVGRQLRDAMSGCVMVANDRMHATDARMLLVAKDV